jgi:hypothetical protein
MIKKSGWNKKSLFLIGKMFITIIFILIFAFPTIQTKAQSQTDVIYDYIILIDTSGSMNDGTPPLFGQVQKVAEDFVNVLQDGSNLIIYSFDTTISQVGSWNSITPSDKSLIVNTIGNMKANGQNTALWDAVCQGVNQLEDMGKTGGQHIQLLISYTDGKDNYSKNPSASCLAKYRELQNSGFTYWIYNAIGGSDVPPEVNDLKTIIGIVDSPNPMPIRVVHIQPTTLKLGNIFQTGKSDPNTSCLVFWSSDPNVYGRELSFGQPSPSGRALPEGTASQVCAKGTDCTRSLAISASEECFQFNLINYLPQNIISAETGSYILNLPLSISYDQPQDQVFLVPNSLKIVFSLDFPPTPTPTYTATATPLPTSTPQPLPTATPLPPETIINCGGSKAINAGLIELDRKLVTTSLKFTCQLDWKKYTLPQSINVVLRFDEKAKDNKELANFIWLSKNGELSKTLKLTETDPNFDVVINVPQDQWKNIGNGNQSFVGELFLQPVNTSLSGDINAEKLSIPVSFQLKKPISLLALALIIGGILILLLLIFIPKLISAGKPPSFQAVLSYENKGNPVRINLMNISTTKVDRNRSKIIVGQSATCNVKLPADPELGGEYFSLEAEKTEGKVEISIIPVETIKINELSVSTRRVLKSKDTIKINDQEYHIFISNT